MKSARPTTETGDSTARPGGEINWLKWGVLFGFWTLFSFLYANQIYFEMLHTPGMHHSWWRIAFWQLTVWYVWGCLSPLILSLGRKFPCDGPSWWRGLLIHLPAAVVIAAVHLTASTSLKMLIEPFDVWSDSRPFLAQYQTELR